MMRRSMLVFCAFALLPVAVVNALDRPLRIVNEGESAKDWAPAGNSPLATPAYPAVASSRDDVCVSLGFRINRDGTTSDLAVLNAWTSGPSGTNPTESELKPFLQSAAAAVSTWRFEAKPGASANRVVYTSTSIAFPSAPEHDGIALRDHCRIPDLKDFIAKAQSQANKRGSLNRNQLERSQSQISHNQEALNAAAARGKGH